MSMAISVVDVVAAMEASAKAHAEKLSWKVSIVDLMKLPGLDSSLTARKALAVELACSAEKMGDSAQMNMWLHKKGTAKTRRQRRQYSSGPAVGSYSTRGQDPLHHSPPRCLGRPVNRALLQHHVQYNENTVECGLFCQALNAVLGSVDGSVRFFGLTPTSMKLEGLDRHQRLIDGYQKLHLARAKVAAISSEGYEPWRDQQQGRPGGSVRTSVGHR